MFSYTQRHHIHYPPTIACPYRRYTTSSSTFIVKLYDLVVAAKVLYTIDVVMMVVGNYTPPSIYAIAFPHQLYL